MLTTMSEPKKPKAGKRGPEPDPESKRSQGVDRHADPRLTFHIERELLDELDAYLQSLPHATGRSQVMRDALREFLRRKGFHPRPAKTEGE